MKTSSSKFDRYPTAPPSPISRRLSEVYYHRGLTGRDVNIAVPFRVAGHPCPPKPSIPAPHEKNTTQISPAPCVTGVRVVALAPFISFERWGASAEKKAAGPAPARHPPPPPPPRPHHPSSNSPRSPGGGRRW